MPPEAEKNSKPSTEELEIWYAYMRKYDYGPPHDLYDLEAFSESYRIRKQLTEVVEKAKLHWDRLGQPYPDHLQAAIDQLKE